MGDIECCFPSKSSLCWCVSCFDDSRLEALGGEPLADIVHNQPLEDDLVAALVHTDLGARVGSQDISLQCLWKSIQIEICCVSVGLVGSVE